jgi:hypothetical protein
VTRIDGDDAIPVSGASASLTQVGGGLVTEEASWGRFHYGGRQGPNGHRYIWISFRVRNSTGAPLNNVTFIPAISGATIPGTPINYLRKLDFTSADTAIAKFMVPTGQVILGDGLRMLSPVQDVLQVYEEAEVAGLTKPSGIQSYFPYGFVTRNTSTPNSRALPAATHNSQFDGLVHFAFRVPLQSDISLDVDGFGIRTVAFQDSEVRLTETIEEGQDSAAVRRLRARAVAMGATTVTVLAGSLAPSPSVPNYPGQRQICSVRTAGTPAAPVTYITNPGVHMDFMILKPGETMDSCAPGFRTGTPGRPATNVPMEVQVRAVDIYGNTIGVRDTVRLEMVPGSPPFTVSAPVQLSPAGVATMTMTFADYGAATCRVRGRRVLSTDNPISIFGVTRSWTAGAGTTSWHTGGNWAGGAVPMSLDSVWIPVAAPLQPTLGANVAIQGVDVENGATIAIGPFDLTAGGNVATGLSGGITGTVGRLILTGVGRTVRGVVPRLRVTGTYSLDGNLTTKAPLRVEAGRLRSTSFRIRTISF